MLISGYILCYFSCSNEPDYDYVHKTDVKLQDNPSYLNMWVFHVLIQ